MSVVIEASLEEILEKIDPKSTVDDYCLRIKIGETPLTSEINIALIETFDVPDLPWDRIWDRLPENWRNDTTKRTLIAGIIESQIKRSEGKDISFACELWVFVNQFPQSIPHRHCELSIMRDLLMWYSRITNWSDARVRNMARFICADSNASSMNDIADRLLALHGDDVGLRFSKPEVVKILRTFALKNCENCNQKPCESKTPDELFLPMARRLQKVAHHLGVAAHEILDIPASIMLMEHIRNFLKGKDGLFDDSVNKKKFCFLELLPWVTPEWRDTEFQKWIRQEMKATALLGDVDRVHFLFTLNRGISDRYVMSAAAFSSGMPPAKSTYSFEDLLSEVALEAEETHCKYALASFLWKKAGNIDRANLAKEKAQECGQKFEYCERFYPLRKLPDSERKV